MAFFDEKAYEPLTNDFPMPDEAKAWWNADFEAGRREVAKAHCRKWLLRDIRANGGFEARDGSPKAVINIRAAGQEDTYKHTGEVAYWLEARNIDNDKHPSRRKAEMLGQMFQALGLIPEDAKPKNGKEVLEMLVAAAQKSVPPASFDAQLRWEKRAYTGNDGNVYHSREHEFAFIKDVKVGDAAAKDDLPF